MSWVVVDLDRENGERRYARIRSQVPTPDPDAPGYVLLQTEFWGGASDGEWSLMRVEADAAEMILTDLP